MNRSLFYHCIFMLAIFWGTPLVQEHTSLIQRRPAIETKDMVDILSLFEDWKVSWRNSDIISSFENKILHYVGSKYAVAFSSGTAWLHSALKGIWIEPWDEVIVPSFTFAASALSILHNLAIPIFCDVDLNTFNIDPKEIEKFITPRTKAIMVVHFQGLPADMSTIIKIAKRYNLKVIEDCAQAFWAKIDDQFCWTFWDVGVFSMNPAKQLPSCWELWCLVTNSKDVANNSNLTKMYGEVISTNGERFYNSLTLWYNYLPNTIQAIFASNKLDHFDKNIGKIIENAYLLSDFIDKNIPFLISPVIPNRYKHVFHMYRLKVDGTMFGINNKILRQAIMDIMEAEGLKLRLYQNAPVPEQKVFKKFIWFWKKFPWCINKEHLEFYKENYKITNFSNTLKIISESFLVWWTGSAPLYFQNRFVIEQYIKGFQKIMDNLDSLLSYCKKIEPLYKEPWDDVAKISDTNGLFI